MINFKIKEINFVFIVALFATMLPTGIYAAQMSSENYSVYSGRVGSGAISIPNTNSESYETDPSFGQEYTYESAPVYICDDNIDNDSDGLTDYPNDPGCSSATDSDETDIVSLDSIIGGGLFFTTPSFLEEKEKQSTVLSVPEVEEEVAPSVEEIVSPIEIEEEVVPLEEELPKQLFDINFEIDESLVVNIKELTSRVIFTNFGTGPTPVNLTFNIINEAGEIVYTEKDYIVVETESVLTKKFEGLELAPGKYTLVLNTLYNVDVSDEFRQEFEITKVREKFGVIKSIWFWIIIIIILIAVVAFIGYNKKRMRQRQLSKQ